MAVSQASFATRAVSDWRCRSTVRSVERVVVGDGRLETHVNAGRGDASVANADFRAVVVAVVVAVVAAVAEVVEVSHDGHCHLYHHFQVAEPSEATVDDAVGTSATVDLMVKVDCFASVADAEALDKRQLESIPNLLQQQMVA